MKTHMNIISVLIFLVLSTGQIFSQQTVEQNKSNGLSTIIFNTSSGKIIVYIPEHLSNKTISGTVSINPNGETEKKKEKNKKLLENYQLSYGGQIISLQENIYTITTSNAAKNSLQLIDNKGKEVGIIVIPTNLIDSIVVHIPPYIVAADFAKISSPCDGILSNNSLTINGMSVLILAESESGVFFTSPKVPGQSDLQFVNEGEITEAKINILVLDLSVGKTNLKHGETTTLSIDISGLEGLEEDIPLDVTNNSPSNISLKGGDIQQIIINPEIDAPTGNYSNTILIQASQSGNFSINVDLQTPGPEETNPENLLCNCYLNGQSYLISPEACQELGGNCNENNEEDTPENLENERPPVFNFEMPEKISSVDSTINLTIEDFYETDIIAVVFSYRYIDNNQWQPIGYDNTYKDGLNVSWNPPSEIDGIIEIRSVAVNKNNEITQDTQFSFLNSNNTQGANLGIEKLPQGLTDNDLNSSTSISEDDIEEAFDKAESTDRRIRKEREKLEELLEKLWESEQNKEENEKKKNELITIDKVLDKISGVYKDSLKVLVDSLINLKNKLPANINPKTLQKAIDDAQTKADDCKKRVEELENEQKKLEAEKDALKQKLDETLEELHKLFTDNGWTGGYGYHADGRAYHGYLGDERSTSMDYGNSKFAKEVDKLKKKIKVSRKRYPKVLKRLKILPEEIDSAKEDCDKLNDALEKAKDTSLNNDLAMATEIAIDDICRQIRSLLYPLLKWCASNPDYCDLKERLRKIMENCPEDLDTFWDEFDEIIKAKKALEKSFGDAADTNQDKIEGLEDDIADSESKIQDLKDQQREEYIEAERKRKQRATELEEARIAKANAKKKKKKQEKKDDKRVRDLIKNAKSDDAGDDAFESLVTGMGLSLLDEATGNYKLGKFIGGILLIKDMPDCVCPLLKALRGAIKAHKDRENPFVYVNDYILKWKQCANIPSISTIMEGSQHLTDAIKDLNESQTKKILNALDQVIRIQQCKK